MYIVQPKNEQKSHDFVDFPEISMHFKLHTTFTLFTCSSAWIAIIITKHSAYYCEVFGIFHLLHKNNTQDNYKAGEESTDFMNKWFRKKFPLQSELQFGHLFSLISRPIQLKLHNFQWKKISQEFQLLFLLFFLCTST